MRPLRAAVRVAIGCLRVVEIGAIRAYRAVLSGSLGGQCRFYPSCSHYAEEAIRVHGPLKGAALAGWRVLRCNPFGKGGFEPVPGARRYDSLIQRATGRGV